MAPCFWVMPNFLVACSYGGGAMLCTWEHVTKRGLDVGKWKTSWWWVESQWISWNFPMFFKKSCWRFFKMLVEVGNVSDVQICWGLVRFCPGCVKLVFRTESVLFFRDFNVCMKSVQLPVAKQNPSRPCTKHCHSKSCFCFSTSCSSEIHLQLVLHSLTLSPNRGVTEVGLF